MRSFDSVECNINSILDAIQLMRRAGAAIAIAAFLSATPT
jgi:hypothetical protein